MNDNTNIFSLVVPSYNRNKALTQTLIYFSKLNGIGEIIIIDDNSQIPYENSINKNEYNIRISIIRNNKTLGAPASRNIGISFCSFDYILFCDDDIILPPNYGISCIKVIVDKGYPCVSGRITYLEQNQSLDDAEIVFGKGHNRKRFDLRTISVDHCAFAEEGEVPFTHAVFMWKKDVIKDILFDERLGRGNGYFEEVTPQITLISKGMCSYVTNSTIAFHLPYSYISGGGNSKSDLVRWWTAIRNGFVVYREYFYILKIKYDIKYPTWVCFLLFVKKQTVFQIFLPNYTRIRTSAIKFIKKTLRIQ